MTQVLQDRHASSDSERYVDALLLSICGQTSDRPKRQQLDLQHAGMHLLRHSILHRTGQLGVLVPVNLGNRHLNQIFRAAENSGHKFHVNPRLGSTSIMTKSSRSSSLLDSSYD